MKQSTQIEESDFILFDALHVLKRKIPIILSFSLIIAAFTFFISKFIIPPTYSSTTKLYVINSSTITSISDLQIGSSLTQDYIQLIQSRPVVQTVIDNLELSYSYEELLDNLSISNPTDTRMLNITIRDTNPYLAKEIADEFATVSIEKINEIMEAEKPRIVEEGYVNTTPISPNVGSNVILYTILGATSIVLIIILAHFFDDTIKTEEDIEKYLNLTTLAEISLETEEFTFFKDERFYFLNKIIGKLGKGFKKICNKLPLVRIFVSKKTPENHTRH